MRSVLGVLSAYLLVLMLASTSPLGTGTREHRNQLLHPAFPHLHHEADGHAWHGAAEEAEQASDGAGPAFGVEAGALVAGGGLSILPLAGAALIQLRLGPSRRVVPADERLPSGVSYRPAHPPPSPTA